MPPCPTMTTLALSGNADILHSSSFSRENEIKCMESTSDASDAEQLPTLSILGDGVKSAAAHDLRLLELPRKGDFIAVNDPFSRRQAPRAEHEFLEGQGFKRLPLKTR